MAVKDLAVPISINVDNLEKELLVYPHFEEKQVLLHGLRHGFDTGISSLPMESYKCKNLQSCKHWPADVSQLIQTELDNGFLIGPFTEPVFPVYRINPLGIVEGK